MKDVRRFPWAMAVVLVMVVVGCKPGGPRRVKVRGVVTLQGEPLANVDVRFFPLGPVGDESIGLSGPDGSFWIEGSRYSTPGIVPGEYTVTTEPLGVEQPPEGAAEGKAAAPRAGKNPIPAIYRSRGQTPLRVTIPETGGSITIELTVPPKRQPK